MFGTKILEERESKYNGHLRVVKSFGLGTYIQANGLTQSGGIVESMWRSTLKRINKLTNQPIDSCLILGLGGGTVAKIVRKNWPGAKITGVDIDPIMIELGKKYLGFDHLGVDIKIQDATKPISGKFDLVIVDLYQGDQIPEKFTTNNYIHLVRNNLTRSGVAIFNRVTFRNNKIKSEKFGDKLKKIFGKVEIYHPVTNIMYICTI